MDDDLAGRWQQLAHQALESNPYAGPDVALSAATHLDGGGRALLLTAERGTELTFALPVIRQPPFRPLPLATLRFWDHPYAFLGTPLLHPHRAVEAWGAVREALREQHLAAWLLIGAMNTDGPVARSLDAAVTRGSRRAARPQMLVPRHRPVAYRRDEPTYLLGHSRRSLRRAITSRRRRLAGHLGGEVDTVDLAWEEGSAAAAKWFLDLESSGWKGRAGTALASDSGSAAFFREMCHRHAARGALQLLSLQGPGQAAAMTCNLLAGDGVFCFKTGYDETLGRCSPGLQLQVENLFHFHDSHRYAWIDSCAGDSELADRVFPDARAEAIVLVPGDAWPAGLLSRGAPPSAAALRRMRHAYRRYAVRSVAPREPRAAARKRAGPLG